MRCNDSRSKEDIQGSTRRYKSSQRWLIAIKIEKKNFGCTSANYKEDNRGVITNINIYFNKYLYD